MVNLTRVVLYDHKPKNPTPSNEIKISTVELPVTTKVTPRRKPVGANTDDTSDQLSGFAMYVRHKNKGLRGRHREKSIAEVVTICSYDWQDLSEAEKRDWKSKAEALGDKSKNRDDGTGVSRDETSVWSRRLLAVPKYMPKTELTWEDAYLCKPLIDKLQIKRNQFQQAMGRSVPNTIEELDEEAD